MARPARTRCRSGSRRTPLLRCRIRTHALLDSEPHRLLRIAGPQLEHPLNYELFMAEAIAEARRGAEEGETPVGAVAVLDDAMIARDHDRMQLEADPTAHAVLLTLQATARKLGTRRLSDVTIFTTHEPCAMCVGALVEAQVRSLVFAVTDERKGAAGSV